MICSDIIKILQKAAPEYLACDWDNVGLQLGHTDKEIKNVLVGLEVNEALIKRAIFTQADLIVTHHPMIFSPMKSITDESFIGQRILTLLENKINYYVMHTNFDAAESGMAALAAEKLQLKQAEPLDEKKEYTDGAGNLKMGGIGRIGDCLEELTVWQLCEKIKKVFGNRALAVYAEKKDMEKKISRVAIVPGSGKDYVQAALEQRADVLITGDITHHAGVDAKAQGLAIIDAGHYRTEQIFVNFMKQYLEMNLDESVSVYSISVEDPFQVL